MAISTQYSVSIPTHDILLIKWSSELIYWIFYLTTEGVTANVKGKMSTREKPNGVFLHVDALLLDLNIKKPRLSVAKIFNNNRILSERRLHSFKGVKWNLEAEIR